MPAYIIAEIQVTDPTAYDGYRPLAAASIARFGGRFAVRGGKVDLLEGGPEPERIVVIEFPDADTARRWYHSEEYQSALKIRRGKTRLRSKAADLAKRMNAGVRAPCAMQHDVLLS